MKYNVKCNCCIHWAVVIQRKLWKIRSHLTKSNRKVSLVWKKTHVAWGHGLINWYCLIRRSLNVALKLKMKWRRCQSPDSSRRRDALITRLVCITDRRGRNLQLGESWSSIRCWRVGPSSPGPGMCDWCWRMLTWWIS